MRVGITARAQKDLLSLSTILQTRVEKQLKLLVLDLHHPSVHAKKYNESNDIWQGRVNRDYRFYFRIEGDIYLIVRITKHPK